MIEYVAPAPAVTRRRRQGKRAPAVEYVSPVVEYVSPAMAYAAPAPVTDYASTLPAGAFAASAPAIEYVAPVVESMPPTAACAAPTPAASYEANLSLVNEKKRLLAAALAEHEAAQCKKQKADETLVNLNAEALLQEEEQEAGQTAKKKAKRKKR